MPLPRSAGGEERRDDRHLNSVNAIAKEVKGPRIASLARAKSEDIEIAARALQSAPAPASTSSSPPATCTSSTSSRSAASRRSTWPANPSAWRARFVDDVEFSPEDATRSDRDFLVEMVRVAVEAGATTINMPDTVGYTTPEEYGEMFREVRERIPAIDDRASSSPRTATTTSAWPSPTRWPPSQAGARQVECTINGIGERAGNAALEEIAAALYVRARPLRRHHQHQARPALSHQPGARPDHHLQASPNKAIVGANAFAHESGIHQHGMLANPLCYEIMTPAWSAFAEQRIVLGKHSGRAALRHRLEQLGFTLSREELQQTTTALSPWPIARRTSTTRT